MRLDRYVLGYRCISVDEKDKAKAANALLRRNLSARIGADGKLLISSLRTKKYKKALFGVDCTFSELYGLPSLILKLRHRYGLIIGFLITIIYILYASSVIWDIRIEGNEKISDAKIEQELQDNGFFIGGRWNKKTLSQIETDVLRDSNEIGWININRRGSVAYVSVREKNVYKDSDESAAFSNLVATEDCVIKEITVRQGVACVKAGDTVRAGELLISGVIPKELGGGFVHADGDVFGISEEQISLTVPKTEIKSEYSSAELCEVRVNILNFSVKLFKKYRKYDNSYDIIEDKKHCVLFGKYRAPFSIQRVYAEQKTQRVVHYTEKEMIDIASLRLNELRARAFCNYDILSLKTSGNFTENGYTLITEATVTKNIGEQRAFSEDN